MNTSDKKEFISNKTRAIVIAVVICWIVWMEYFGKLFVNHQTLITTIEIVCPILYILFFDPPKE